MLFRIKNTPLHFNIYDIVKISSILKLQYPYEIMNEIVFKNKLKIFI